MKKNKKFIIGLLLLAFQAVSAQGYPKSCIDEILALQAKNPNFDVQKFLTDLPAEVVKTKVKLKLPFGKPKDTEVTSIGITVGCAKVFPENPAQIATTVKDISIELAKKMGQKAVGATVASALGATDGSVVAGLLANAPLTVPATAAGAPAKTPPTPISTGPVLKQCDFVFNPEKKFCYDGAAYDKCDNMEYNPTTHICTGDIASRALCNNIQYNPTIQRCENNTLHLKCGDNWYNPATHFCYDKSNVAVAKCGINPQSYNPDLMECKPKINANGIFLKTPVQHEGENYEAVLIGEQIWLSKNLNNNIESSVCYDNNVDNCATYGRLYDLETARTACPTGWYLPSDAEWAVLASYVGGMANAGGKLKATSFGGTDNYGFAALPSGFSYSNSYSGAGDLSYWWSSTEFGLDGAYGWYLERGNGILNRNSLIKSSLFGIRCLQYVNPQQRKNRFLVNVTSEPAGVTLKFNGTTPSNCSTTPCKIELLEGKYNINFTKEFYDSTNTAINLTGDRYVNIKLVPNFGILSVKDPDYLNDIGRHEQWNITINDNPTVFGDIMLFPNNKYSIKLTHRCYGDIVDSVSVKKGENMMLDLTNRVTLKQSPVSLNATYKWKTVEEPVFVNQQEIGKTPFKGHVPLCSEIAIMEPYNNIEAKLSEYNIYEYTYKKSIFLSTFGGTALNLAGAVLLGIGLSANADVKDYYNDYSKLDLSEKQSKFDDLWEKYEKKKKSRNIYYLVGSVLLVSGIGVHIWF
ncbi:MAG: PEGA domain-containing protein [Fibromonadaceae bacterium]|jgi:uncharacterized protein (TIGR02145 family)|nr:PEGA domain-containing protein [Fibromonadaceae bacterium]